MQPLSVTDLHHKQGTNLKVVKFLQISRKNEEFLELFALFLESEEIFVNSWDETTRKW